ncbi:MAG: glycosyltransferase family 39 protein [Deltaproteobacteria bacterium]|nr:glycosyltransferase family 39 protein [Deltaproteobacteria bacterium]
MADRHYISRLAKTAAPYAAYIALACFFIKQPPMHEEVMHLRDTGSWASALSYSCHPPLYVMLGRIARIIFGEGYRALYILGIFAGLINLYLIGRIINAVLEDLGDKKEAFSLAGVWIAVLMPVFVQGSLLLEIEPAVLTPLSLLALLYYIRKEGRGGTGFYAMTGVLFALTMWAKYFFTPFLLIFSIFIYEATGGKMLRDALRSSVIMLGTALAIFVPTYLLYSKAFITGANSFAFLALDKTKEGAPLFASLKIFFPMATKLMALTFWLSPFFIAAVIWLMRRIFHDRQTFRKERLFAIATACIFVFYLTMHPYPFGESKYFYPIFPLLAVLGSSLLARSGLRLPPLRYAVLIIPATAVIFFTIGDPLYQAIGLYRSLSMGRLYLYVFFYASINLALFGAAYAIFNGRGFSAFGSSLVYLSICSSLSLFASQAIGQYQTRSQYGENGALETVSFIRSGVPSSSRVIIPGDIRFYTEMEFVKVGAVSEGAESIAEWDWIVERKANILRLKPEASSALVSNYRLLRHIGSYEIYRRR